MAGGRDYEISEKQQVRKWCKTKPINKLTSRTNVEQV